MIIKELSQFVFSMRSVNDDDKMNEKDAEAAVRQTSLDALACKLSAIQCGYLEDSFAVLLQPKPLRGPIMKRPPIINRGTFARTMAVDLLFDSFLKQFHSKVQILSLGAGADSRPFRMLPKYDSIARYIEVDLEENAEQKMRLIMKHASLNQAAGADLKMSRSEHGSALCGSRYSLLSGNLIYFESRIVPLLERCQFDMSLPTLVLCECTLVYIEREPVDAMLKWFTSNLSNVICVTYEQTSLNDNFGRVMLSNLASRHISLPGLVAVPTLESQMQRYEKAGFERVQVRTMLQVYDAFDKAEHKRISQLEMLDELEEWSLLLSHYCLVIAVHGQGEELLSTNVFHRESDSI